MGAKLSLEQRQTIGYKSTKKRSRKNKEKKTRAISVPTDFKHTVHLGANDVPMGPEEAGRLRERLGSIKIDLPDLESFDTAPRYRASLTDISKHFKVEENGLLNMADDLFDKKDVKAEVSESDSEEDLDDSLEGIRSGTSTPLQEMKLEKFDLSGILKIHMKKNEEEPKEATNVVESEIVNTIGEEQEDGIVQNEIDSKEEQNLEKSESSSNDSIEKASIVEEPQIFGEAQGLDETEAVEEVLESDDGILEADETEAEAINEEKIVETVYSSESPSAAIEEVESPVIPSPDSSPIKAISPDIVDEVDTPISNPEETDREKQQLFKSELMKLVRERVPLSE